MKGRHAAPGWSPFWRDILLRSVLALLLIAMAVFIWWLFSEDEIFTGAVTTTSAEVTTSSTTEAPTTTEPAPPTSTTVSQAPTTTTTTVPPTTTSSTTTIPPPLQPSELVVRVFNANGVAGIAGRTTAALEEAGYGVANPDNHPQFLDISRVWYREGLLREAQILQESWVADALVELVPLEQEGIDIMVIVGRSFEE